MASDLCEAYGLRSRISEVDLGLLSALSGHCRSTLHCALYQIYQCGAGDVLSAKQITDYKWDASCFDDGLVERSREVHSACGAGLCVCCRLECGDVEIEFLADLLVLNSFYKILAECSGHSFFLLFFVGFLSLGCLEALHECLSFVCCFDLRLYSLELCNGALKIFSSFVARFYCGLNFCERGLCRLESLFKSHN